MERLQYSNSFYFYGNKALLRGKLTKVKTLLESIITDHKKTNTGIEINLISDEDLLQINIDNLQHDYYTDIITFDYSKGKNLSGDIYISIDRIKDNAKEYQTTLFNELLRVLCHGVLHLCGYKDKLKKDKTKMTEMENKYLKQYARFHVEPLLKNK